MALALFDLDKTLLDGDSDYEWGQFLVNKELVDPKEYAEANDYFYEEYKQGTLDIVEYSAFSFKPLSERTKKELDTLHQEFMQTVIIPIIRSKSLETIEKHHAQGDVSVIITATNSFITRPIAEHLGVQHLIATEPKITNGSYTTEIEGTPCFQGGKVTRLNDWVKTHNESLEGSFFYSDSINDLPLLEVVDTPIIVTPDERLEAIAKDRNWPIITLM